MTVGKLVLVVSKKKKKTLQVSFVTKKGKSFQTNIKETELSAPLAKLKVTSPEALDGMEVELEEVGGQPTKIRQVGEEWQSGSTVPIDREFHNPYNFVPTLPRDNAIEQKSDLGDASPAGHGVYHNHLWSGQIAIEITTQTPLLIPDAATSEEIEAGDSKGHKTFKTRLGADGLPLLPATSIKGMLRSAYEIVTNSRLSIFEKHGDRLAYRMPAEGKPANGMAIAPARVEKLNDRILQLRLMKSVKLKRYRSSYGATLPVDKGESEDALRYGNGELPNCGKAVWVRVEGDKAIDIKPMKPGQQHSDEPEYRRGWVCLTGANIANKQFERIFLEREDDRILTFERQSEGSQNQSREEIVALWRDLIANYQKIHEKDLEKRKEDGFAPKDYLGDEPGQTGWSRHIYEPGAEVLQQGTLCYVEMDGAGRINALLPVAISRHLYEKSPDNFLDPTLAPPESMADLSPVDRVFGWVRRTDTERSQFKTAYKGNLRISAVKCLAKKRKDAIADFAAEGLPLAILGAPKPEQVRFYLAEDRKGTPLDRGKEKATGYRDGQSLRGHKVYPHHQGLPDGHWDDPMRDRTQHAEGGHFQEYRRPRKEGSEQRDSQNRSLKDWVKPGVTFAARMDITNLSSVELGALLYLLELPEGCFHRLGGGKPLGFGSVRSRVKWEGTDLRLGSEWRTFYETLTFAGDLTPTDPKTTIETYKAEVAGVYGDRDPENFETVPFIQAFLRSAKGFDDQKPVHYPRIRPETCQGNPPPDPEGESFKWFVENERVGQNLRLSLPFLARDRGLPYLQEPKDEAKGRSKANGKPPPRRKQRK